MPSDMSESDYRNSLKFIMDDELSSQEEHCSCVSILKRRIRELEAEVKLYEGKDFWTNWVYPEGANPEQIQNELLDYKNFLEETAKVYDYVTNGRITKQNTIAREVIGVFDELWMSVDDVDEIRERI